MTDEDYQLEQALRAQTREKNPRLAARILADFYEQHGQPSRAALWRKDVLVRVRAKFPADQIIHDPQWQRKVTMWLAKNEASLAAVSRAFRSSVQWVGALNRQVENNICAAANHERHHPTMAATLRLQAAGALPPRFDRSVFVLGDPPPESWPVTPTTYPVSVTTLTKRLQESA